MIDLKQAAQMALDALLLPTMKTQQMLIQRDEAIIALRRALAEPEQDPVAWMHPMDFGRDARVTGKQVSDEQLPLYTTPPQQQAEPVAVYGYCPYCGAEGVMRERRPNGNDKCTNGHTYPSSTALKQQAEPTSTTYTLNTTKTAAVAAEFYWLPIDQNTPRGVKILLLGRGGVASLGHYHHKPGESEFWTHWAPLPKKP